MSFDLTGESIELALDSLLLILHLNELLVSVGVAFQKFLVLLKCVILGLPLSMYLLEVVTGLLLPQSIHLGLFML